MPLINKLPSGGISQKGNLSLHKHLGILVYIFTGCLCNAVQAAEVTPFKITNVGGSLSLISQTNKQESISEGSPTQTSESQNWQEKLSLNMSSYVYHPNFLKMDFGAGLLYNQKTVDSTEEKSQVADLSAKLDFLSKKPTPVSVYYKQTNIYTPIGLSDNFLLKQVNYGANIGLHQPLSPIDTKLSASRNTSYGSNAEQITDEEHERVMLDMSYSYGGSSVAYINLNHQINNRISRSGNLSLPIAETESSSSSTGIKTRNTFGSDHQFRLDSTAGYRKQDEYPERESWYFRPELDWKHNENFTSYYTYATDHTNEQDIESENNRTTARLNYSDDNSLAANIGLTHNNSKSTGIDSESKGANFGLSKQMAVSYGKYSASYNASFNIHDQTSALTLLPVYGDEYILSGVTQVTINQIYIDTTTIIVSNLTRTQTFVEGSDYTITTIGNQTLIERVSSGNITDGQSVLIDYSYQSGGTYKKESLTQGLNLGLNIAKYYDLSARFYQTKQILKEGIPTIVLDSSDGTILSLRVDRPLEKGVTVGGEIMSHQHNEDSNPYNEQSINAFVNTPLFEKAVLRLSAGLLKRDNENSDEDVDTETVGLRISARPWTRVGMIFDSSYSQNTGGSVERTMLINNLDLNWNYRQLRYKATIKNQSEEQGIYERNSWSIFMQLTRSF